MCFFLCHPIPNFIFLTIRFLKRCTQLLKLLTCFGSLKRGSFLGECDNSIFTPLSPLQIKEVRDFAGQEIEVKKFIDADSKEALEKAKAPPPSGVDAVLEQIKKKQKLSVLDKSKKDWGEFKEDKKLEEELDAYKKSSNQYLDKVSFLQRADYREFERERDARLAVQAKRRPDMREEP